MRTLNELPQGQTMITVWLVRPSWVMPSGEIKAWRMIIEIHGELTWVTTYDPTIAKPGIRLVWFKRNTVNEAYITRRGDMVPAGMRR